MQELDRFGDFIDGVDYICNSGEAILGTGKINIVIKGKDGVKKTKEISGVMGNYLKSFKNVAMADEFGSIINSNDSAGLIAMFKESVSQGTISVNKLAS